MNEQKDNEIDITNETFLLNLDANAAWTPLEMSSSESPEGRYTDEVSSSLCLR